MMACLLLMMMMGMSTLLVLNILQRPFPEKEELGLSFLSHYPHAQVQNDFALDTAEVAARDREWQDALRHNEIEDTVVIGHHGLAKKYVFILKGGYVAMAKPMERDLLFWPRSVLGTFYWDELKPVKAIRMDRDFQGWGEVCGTALDRVLQWYRKPTVVGRFMDSKILYMHDYTYWGRLLYWLPSRLVRVSMHAWVTGLNTRSPSYSVGEYLRHHEPLEKLPSASRVLDYADVVLFDFLLDDHDRMGTHNWKTSADGRMMVWDSGLAWNYGPYHADTEILCGTHIWNGDHPIDTPHDIRRPHCKRICRFRKESIEQLRAFHRPGAVSLGEALEEEMNRDGVPHAFESGIYNIHRSGWLWWFNAVGRFHTQDFFEGIDHRVQVLLDHVEYCIDQYGEDQVLM